MLISLDSLVQKYNIQIKGILHVGAHECEELPSYENYITRDNILWVEALPDKVDMCKQKFPNLLIENAVVSDKVETVTFNRSNNGQSSSFLDFGLHKVHHPYVWYVDSFSAETKLLEEILCNYSIPYNFVNLDIQGTELKALMGMESYLPTIDYIYTEVNSDYVYENCSLINEIDDYLGKFGFKRVETKWWEDCKWGDAFYIRNI
jgi:FkbM family methyltransferase